MSTYADEITRTMTWLGKQPDTVFIGQQVLYHGNAMFKTLAGVPDEKKIEMPVAEELQMGVALGMALTGKTVITIYPRFDFLLCAMNQLVNHVDKLKDFTHGQYRSRENGVGKVIVRVGVGSRNPMYPGPQHCGDYTSGLQLMLQNSWVMKATRGHYEKAYKTAYKLAGASVIVEMMEEYGS